MLSAMFGNWIFTATRSGRPVGETGEASTAWWTCPIEAAAKGIGLKIVNEERHDGPREEAITLWVPKSQFRELLESVVRTSICQFGI